MDSNKKKKKARVTNRGLEHETGQDRIRYDVDLNFD